MRDFGGAIGRPCCANVGSVVSHWRYIIVVAYEARDAIHEMIPLISRDRFEAAGISLTVEIKTFSVSQLNILFVEA